MTDSINYHTQNSSLSSLPELGQPDPHPDSSPEMSYLPFMPFRVAF
jgi:hypothetical protein